MGLGCKRTDWPFLSIGMQSEAGSWSTDGAPWELSKAFLRASVSSGKEDIDQPLVEPEQITACGVAALVSVLQGRNRR